MPKSFLRIRDQRVDGKGSPRIALKIEPLDRISWPAAGVKHHGILLYAERGLNLRVPSVISEGAVEELYGEILAQWLDEARDAYAQVLAKLLLESLPVLLGEQAAPLFLLTRSRR